MKTPMKKQHPLAEKLMMSYSAGTLSEELDLLLAIHLCFSDEARAVVGAYDVLGGVLLETQNTQQSMSPGSLEKVLMQIEKSAPQEDNPMTPDHDLPPPLWPYVGPKQDNIPWSSLARGIQECVLKTQRENIARLMHIPPYTQIPEHSHEGIEITIVIHGDYRDGHEHCTKGEAMLAADETVHAPFTQERPCFCLVVTQPRFNFMMVNLRKAQKLFNI